ncbi:MAG: hypothetical protein ACLFP4_15345 [Spirochaetales bacterium]
MNDQEIPRIDVMVDDQCPSCLQDTAREELYYCAACDHPVCPACIREVDGEPLCPDCYDEETST